MMKKDRSFECDEEDREHYGSDAEDHYRERKKTDRQNHFAKMESRGSAYVEIQIGVMHVVKSPEERDHVHGPVPPPVGVIHQEKRGDKNSPRGQSKPV